MYRDPYRSMPAPPQRMGRGRTYATINRRMPPQHYYDDYDAYGENSGEDYYDHVDQRAVDPYPYYGPQTQMVPYAGGPRRAYRGAPMPDPRMRRFVPMQARMPMIGNDVEEGEEGEKPWETDVVDDFFEVFDDPKATPPDFGWGPNPRPDDPIDEARGVERRELLSDFVRRGDPRSREERAAWNPDEGFLVNPGYEGGPPPNGVSTTRLLELNMHGLLDMQSTNDQEMQLARQTSLAALPEEVASKLAQRFEYAQDRAFRSEQRAFGERNPMMSPTYVAGKLAGAPRYARSVFDAQTRANDAERAITFYHSNPHHLDELLQSASKADANERSQYGDHVRDLIGRIEMRLNDPANPRPVSVSGSADPLHPLNIPVLSRAKWTTKSVGARSVDASEDGDADANKRQPAYYRRGNDHFLASALKMRSVSSRLRAEEDAVRFFGRQFGLDFSKESGAKVDPKTRLRRHATLPVVLEPYTVSGDGVSSRLEMAEGHLGSSVQKRGDIIGNGYERFEGGGDTTSVMEVGWMVRPTSEDGMALKRGSGGPAKAGGRLARGGILNTGFWVVNRPDAAPALLRFQSSRAPTVKFQKTRGSGFRHISTNFYNVADMSHDASARPMKGIGNAVSVVAIDHPERKNIRAQTWVTLHS